MLLEDSRGFAFQVKSRFAQYRQILSQHYISDSVSARNILQLEKKGCFT